MSNPKTVGVSRAAQLLQVSEWGVKNLTQRGVLRCERDEHNRRRYKFKDVQRLARLRATEQSDR